MIKSYAPSSPLLSKYIECFYTYEGIMNSDLRYLAFPTFNTGLSFFRGANINRKEWEIEISEGNKTKRCIEILGKYTKPVLINYHGQLSEISVVFKPLGINHFLHDSYHSIAPNFSQEFKNDAWSDFAKELQFESEDLPQLELFLMSQLSESQKFNELETSLELLKEVSPSLTIEEIAEAVGLTQKTFLRHFKKHMGCSPVEYRRIFKFRNLLQEKITNNSSLSLTELTYLLGYTDQSYLIKEFQKLTSHKPKNFFKSVSLVDGDKIIWEIK